MALAPEQWALYSTPKPNKASLIAYYGLKPSDKPLTTLSSVSTFLEKTGLDHRQLQELLFEDLSKAEIEHKLNADFFINVGSGNCLDISNDQLQNLTLGRLDRIQRFVRLAQAIKWSFTDLNWALRTIGLLVNTNKAAAINNKTLPYLAWMQEQQHNNNLTINECCALIGSLKDFGQKNGPSFFSRVFENPPNPQPPA